jgi:uncharacterized cupin superfamily protein
MTARLAVTAADVMLEDSYGAPYCEASGDARSALFHPRGYSLWQLVAHLGTDAELWWHERHGDEAVYVLDGELDVSGARCGPRDVLILEAGVATEARATRPTRLLHSGPASPEAPDGGLLGAPLATGHRIHIVGRAEALVQSTSGATVVTRYYADSTCPTCRIAFFEVQGTGPHTPTSHFHSEDEIIHVLRGDVRFGATAVGAGMSVAIPAGRRYGIQTTGDFALLNYRRNASVYTAAPGEEPLLETVDAIRALAEA